MGRLIVDAVALEGRAETVRAPVVARPARGAVFLDRCEHFPRRFRVLRGDGCEIQSEHPIGFEEHPEALRIRDRPVDGAPLKPCDRGREIQVVGERARKRLHPAFAHRGVGRSSLRDLRPVTDALTEMIERLRSLSKGAQGKLHPRPVMREQALVAEGERVDIELDELVDGDGIARRFRHLHAVGEQVLPMDPVRDRRVAVCALGLGDLVLVMRKDVVDTARVQIETLAKVFGAHRGTLDVPAGKTGAPRRIPGEGGTARLRLLPEREVGLIALVWIEFGVDTLPERFADVSGEPSVAREPLHGEIDRALDLVRETPRDEALDDGDHLGNVIGRAREVRRREDPQAPFVVVKPRLV